MAGSGMGGELGQSAGFPGSANIDLYERMVDVSACMLAAVRQGDWDTLAHCERRCRALVAAVPASTPGSAAAPAAPPLAGAQRQRKVELIRRLLANDAAIRGFTEPWRASIDPLLQSAAPAG